jgi:hypothetical protein
MSLEKDINKQINIIIKKKEKKRELMLSLEASMT